MWGLGCLAVSLPIFAQDRQRTVDCDPPSAPFNKLFQAQRHALVGGAHELALRTHVTFGAGHLPCPPYDRNTPNNPSQPLRHTVRCLECSLCPADLSLTA